MGATTLAKTCCTTQTAPNNAWKSALPNPITLMDLLCCQIMNHDTLARKTSWQCPIALSPTYNWYVDLVVPMIVQLIHFRNEWRTTREWRLSRGSHWCQPRCRYEREDTKQPAAEAKIAAVTSEPLKQQPWTIFRSYMSSNGSCWFSALSIFWRIMQPMIRFFLSKKKF